MEMGAENTPAGSTSAQSVTKALWRAARRAHEIAQRTGTKTCAMAK